MGMEFAIESGGTSVRVRMQGKGGSDPGPALIFLHGAGGNFEMWPGRLGTALSGLGCGIYAVRYFDRTGTQRAGPAEVRDPAQVQAWLATVADALRAIAARPEVDTTRLVLAGVSLGAFLALAAATLPDVPALRALVAVSGGLAEPWAAQATARFPATLILHGEEDAVVPASHALELAATLARLGVAHELAIEPGEGHWFSPAAQTRLLARVRSFLAPRLGGPNC